MLKGRVYVVVVPKRGVEDICEYDCIVLEVFWIDEGKMIALTYNPPTFTGVGH
jgi:hypothetical protein